MNRCIIRYARVILLLLLAAGCITSSNSNTPYVTIVTEVSQYHPQWRAVFRGIDIAQGHKKDPEPVSIVAARVDLKAQGISFIVTPPNGDRPKETDGQTASEFLKANHCQLVINATPFDPVDDLPGAPRDILGLSISKGDVYSKEHGEHGALLITRKNKATIGEPPFDLKNAYNAVAGYFPLLSKGELLGVDEKRHPRTAVGVSQDGRYLYMLVVDGRQPGHSVGATTRETAIWMKQLGAYDALNLDGGGSSVMVIDDGIGNATVLNVPIHNNLPRTQRINGNHLGVFATPLK